MATATTPKASLRILLDANVILDVLARREPFLADSAAILAACETGRCRGFLAAHTVTILHYLLSKRSGSGRARAALVDLLKIVQVARVDAKVIAQALVAESPDFENAVQMAAADIAGVDYVVTRNLSHFDRGPIPALRPAEVLTLLQ
jgi:predicted nucleic acid-binding protein